MDAKLCATVTGETTEELRAARDQVRGADLVELRLDFAADVDVSGALAGRPRPAIVTCRPTWEGGRFAGSEEERHHILSQALQCGADYVDIERRAGFDDLVQGEHRDRIVLSLHDFDGVPGDLDTQVREMRSTGAAVIKVAVHVETLADLIALRRIGEEAGAQSQRQVLIGMGPAGLTSRLLPDRFHSCWTYAGADVAPGQVDLGRMLNEFRVRSTTADTKVYGVLGAPIAHSLSPAMHNAGFATIGANVVYIPFEASDIDDFATFADVFDVQGASVTAPFKEAVMSKLQSADELGQRVGAVNTIRREAGAWTGINTDVPGFLAPLTGRIALDGCRATVLGAGGAARGVVVALADQGARVTVSARSRHRAMEVAALGDGTVTAFPPAEGTWDLLVNTTPVGTFPQVASTPLGDTGFGGGLVYDLVYNPTVTKLLADAERAGCATIGGLDMLVAQAERQFTWWIGTPPPAGTFRAAADRRLAETRPAAVTPGEGVAEEALRAKR